MAFAGALFSQGLSNLGLSWDQIVAQTPALAGFINGISYEHGVFIVGFGLFGMALSTSSYRRGERQAWYTGWIMVGVFAALIPLALSGEEGGGILTFVIFTSTFVVMALLGLLLPYRKFFSKRQP